MSPAQGALRILFEVVAIAREMTSGSENCAVLFFACRIGYGP
jgi:hypothetical protein